MANVVANNGPVVTLNDGSTETVEIPTVKTVCIESAKVNTVDVNNKGFTVEANGGCGVTVTGGTNATAVVQGTKVMVVAIGIAGPQGPSGVVAGSVLTINSGEDLGGHRAVFLVNGNAFHASSDAPTAERKVIGITTGASITNASANILPSGELVGLSALTPDEPVYLGLNGVITQALPATGFIQQLGVALTSTKILVAINQPIRLA